MVCFSCFSGLFSSKQPEKPKEDPGVGCGAVDEEKPLTEPVEAAGAPAEKEAEDVPSTAAQADPEEPMQKSESRHSYMGIPSVQPAEPEPAAPAHFEGSDAEDGKAARGCCAPIRRKGTKGNKGTKVADLAKADGQEAAPTADLAKAADAGA